MVKLASLGKVLAASAALTAPPLAGAVAQESPGQPGQPANDAGNPRLKGSGTEITLPSGAVVRWQETLHDNSGGIGLTYRFRFVMPDLAQRVPSTSGPASDFEDARGPIDIDTESGEVTGDIVTGDMTGGDTGEDMANTAEIAVTDPDSAGSATDATETETEGDEEAADALLEDPVLPAAPDVLAQDPVHHDVVWLCENWALPRVASPAPRPSQIIISLADKEIAFGAYDPDVVQLFEAFRLPPDRDTCEWEPW